MGLIFQVSRCSMHLLSLLKSFATVFSGPSPGNTAPELNMLGTSPKCGHVYLEECMTTYDSGALFRSAFSSSI